jgi:TatD DNase family protein
VFFVDTHCHLNFESFQDSIQQVVDRALEAGVNRIVVPGMDIRSSEKAVELASRFEHLYAAIGVHPNECGIYHKEDYRLFEGLSREQKVVAIGEIGLDFYHHPENQIDQFELLESMLTLASDHQKPVILHSRNALDPLFQVIKKWLKGIQFTDRFFGVFHGFEGDTSQASTVQSLHMAVGIGGPVTFKNAVDKQKLVKDLGINNLVLETDSPLLSPHPFRGQPNEPSRIPLIAQKIANLLELSIEDVADITSKNAYSLFRWDDFI